jgi:hypothetical protein
LTAFLDEITDEEFENFVRGSLGIELVPRKKPVPGASPAKDDGSLIVELRESSSRQGALDLLRSKKRSKAELMQLARRLQSHVEKHDTVDTIEEKIVENVIGSRLRSEAIQGLSLKGSSSDVPLRKDRAEEMTPTAAPRAPKDAPSSGRDGANRRASVPPSRDELRDKIIRLSNLLYTTTREPDWWSRRFEVEIPEIVEHIGDTVVAFPDSDELKRNLRTLLARFSKVKENMSKGVTIEAEQTQAVAAALNDVADALMRIN